MTRYALLIGPGGRKRRLPITDTMQLQDSYEFHGDRYTVIGVFTAEDIPVDSPLPTPISR